MEHRRSAISEEQKKIMVEFLEKNSNLVKGKFSASFTQKDAQTLWENLAETLNSIPTGSRKDWKQWRKAWHDLRSKAKGKEAERRKYLEGTGGGPQMPGGGICHETIIKLLNPTSISGISIAETPTDFDFDSTPGIENADPQPSTSSTLPPYSTDMVTPELIKHEHGHDYLGTPHLGERKRCSTADRFTKKRKIEDCVSASNKLMEQGQDTINVMKKQVEALQKLNTTNERIATSLENIASMLVTFIDNTT